MDKYDYEIMFKNREWNKLIKSPLVVGTILSITVLALLVTVFSTAFTTKTGSVDVVYRFGKVVREVGPGLHFKVPYIETRTTVPTAAIFTQTFGFRPDASPEELQKTKDETFSESLMLCGDLSILDVKWAVQFRIAEPVKFLTNIEDPMGLLRDLSEFSMRMVVGDKSFDHVLTNRDVVFEEVKRLLQEELDASDSGILVTEVESRDTTPPEPVREAYLKVNDAELEKTSLVHKANQEVNKLVPGALGRADAIIEEAKGRASEIVNTAEGRFRRYEENRLAWINNREITEKRMYYDVLGEVLQNAKVNVIDENVGSVPLVHLNKEAK